MYNEYLFYILQNGLCNMLKPSVSLIWPKRIVLQTCPSGYLRIRYSSKKGRLPEKKKHEWKAYSMNDQLDFESWFPRGQKQFNCRKNFSRDPKMLAPPEKDTRMRWYFEWMNIHWHLFLLTYEQLVWRRETALLCLDVFERVHGNQILSDWQQETDCLEHDAPFAKQACRRCERQVCIMKDCIVMKKNDWLCIF